MIRYSLRCGKAHEFEGWFRSSAAFDEEVAGLACPLCNDRQIEKAIMAPAVLQQAPAPAEPASTDPASVDTAPAGSAPAPQAPPAASAGGQARSEATPVAAVPIPMPVARPPSPEQVQLARMVTALRRLRAHVEAHFEHVGNRFAAEARKIHNEEADPRGIYGQATADEVEELIEEGIEIAPLPDLPKLDG